MTRPKFIINHGDLVIGNVEFHKDLVKDHSQTKGGGWWHLDRANGIMYLYNKSIDFGQAKREDVIQAVERGLLAPSVSKLRFFHSTKESLHAAMEDPDGVWITPDEELD